LAWAFPPTASIASVRTWNLAKNLARLGWEVTVVTPHPDLIRHNENPERARANLAAEGIHQILTGHKLRFLDPDFLACRNRGFGWLIGGICRKLARRLGISRGIGWIKAAERACLPLRPQDVDVILASAPAFSSFVLAERLSRRLGRPYILDYRDPWWTEVMGMFRGMQGLIDKLEARLVGGANAVTVVSPSWATDLNRRFTIGSKLHVITNGYDPEDLAGVKPHDFGHFAMVYTGLFYPPIRVVTPVLEALKRVMTRNKASGEWYFHYYGMDERHVRDEVDRIGVSDHVKVHGNVSRDEALSAARGANLAVVISSVHDTATSEINGWIPAKLYEAIGLSTPVLLIGPPECDAERIAEPTGLVRRIAGNDIDGIAAFIEDSMSGAGFTTRDVDSITWKCLAAQFDRVLRQELVQFQPMPSASKSA